MRSALKLLALLTRLYVAALLVACLVSAVVPNAAIVSAFGIGGAMSCCIGKSSGHCTVALKIKHRQPPPEPMCGIRSAPVDDGITVVDDELDSDSQTEGGPAVGMASINNNCAVECTARARSSSQQQKRHSALLVTQTSHALIRSLNQIRTLTPLGSKSNAAIEPFSPRGPPRQLVPTIETSS
jgi:hypothetical protein